MAWKALASHRLRTLLTMLGIIIGITAVVCVVALGQGARQKSIDDINSCSDTCLKKGFGPFEMLLIVIDCFLGNHDQMFFLENVIAGLFDKEDNILGYLVQVSLRGFKI